MKMQSNIPQIFPIAVLLLISNVAISSAITLSNEKEIQIASELNHTIGAISQKVMGCIDKNNGKMDGCVCKTYESCKFKSEYKKAITKYCDAITEIQAWKSKAINYTYPYDPMSYSLGI